MFQGCPYEKETAYVRRLVISSPPGQKEKRRGLHISLYLLPNPLNYCLYFATWKLLNKYCLNQREFSRGHGEDTKTRRKTLWIWTEVSRPEPYTKV